MEFRGTMPPFAIGAEDVPDLAAVFARPGPFVTVYLTTDPETENAAHKSETHWRAVRQDLEQQGAPSAAIEAIGALVPEAHLRGRTLAAIADDSGVLVARAQPQAADRDIGRFATLPSIGPMLEWEQRAIPHIAVLADRVGADIAVFAAHGRRGLSSVGEEDGRDPDLHKSAPGGWSQHRYQERAENTWEANAKQVAARVTSLAELTDARLILVAGDVRAEQFLRENLPERLAGRVHHIEGQRAAGVDFDSIADDIVKLVASEVASETVAIVEKFREEKGQADRAVEGLDATLAALNGAQVEMLLIHDDPADQRETHLAPDATLVGDPEVLAGYGVSEPRRGRLVDALIAAAFATGAKIRIVPSTVAQDGIGAILRFTTT